MTPHRFARERAPCPTRGIWFWNELHSERRHAVVVVVSDAITPNNEKPVQPTHGCGEAMNKIALLTVLGAVLAGCGQQTTADLAVCKSDLTRAQAEIETAKAAQAAADAKVAALEQAQTALQAKVTEFETAAAEVAAKADAAKAKATAYQQSVKKAAATADVKNAPTTTPVKQMTQEQKNKALGF